CFGAGLGDRRARRSPQEHVPEEQDQESRPPGHQQRSSGHQPFPRYWFRRSAPERAAAVRSAVDVNVTNPVAPARVDEGSQRPASERRSPTRSSQRAAELWSKPMALTLRVPTVPGTETGPAPDTPAFWPVNDVSHTSLGMTVATSPNSRVQATSSE